MKITVDTNVLIRAVMQDDARQAAAASRLLQNAEIIAVSLPCLCEFAWVLHRVYSLTTEDIAAAIRALLDVENVVVSRPAVETGLAVLSAGGDFADGVIAYEGQWLGGETFVSFDKKAISLVMKQGQKARLLG